MKGFPLLPREKTTCVLGACGVIEATSETIASLRKHPGPEGGPTIAPNLLHHADEQTVVALAAVLHAIHAARLEKETFADWAVVGSPRFPGRTTFATSLEKFRRSGSLSVSPLIIPFTTLHAVSSMIGLALQMNGPSFGVGGGSDGFAQALLAGLALQQENESPGVWVVVTGWDPEPLGGSDTCERQPVCRGAALALLPDAVSASGSRVRLVPRVEIAGEGNAVPSLPELVRFLASASSMNPIRKWSCPLNADFCLELSQEPVRVDVSLLARSA